MVCTAVAILASAVCAVVACSACVTRADLFAHSSPSSIVSRRCRHASRRSARDVSAIAARRASTDAMAVSVAISRCPFFCFGQRCNARCGHAHTVDCCNRRSLPSCPSIPSSCPFCPSLPTLSVFSIIFPPPLSFRNSTGGLSPFCGEPQVLVLNI